MKKALIAGLIGLTALPAAAQAAASNNPGCQKTFWNSTWFGLSYFIGQCK